MIVRKISSFCLCRFGMLSDELVPHAESILAALAKHLEAKLSLSEPIHYAH